MTRREARIQAMQILYTADFNTISIKTAAANFHEGELPVEIKAFLDLVDGRLEEIDSIISASMINYNINRLNLVDKAIIRLATAEMLDNKIEKKIIINEALEITKEYTDQGDHKATSFNNRLLENIANNIYK